MEPSEHSVAESGGTARATIAFVDLVKFASLTDIHGDLAGADAATSLAEIAEATLGRDIRLVKAAGDGVLLAAVTATAGLRSAAEIIEGVHELELGLDVRGGLDHGPVVERDGDVFGSTVNLAARLAAVAEPGTLAFTRDIALVAGDVDLTVTPLGSTEVRGFHTPIELFLADPCRHDDSWLADPVCGMRIRADRAIAPVDMDRRRIGFCSARCAQIFEQGVPGE